MLYLQQAETQRREVDEKEKKVDDKEKKVDDKEKKVDDKEKKVDDKEKKIPVTEVSTTSGTSGFTNQIALVASALMSLGLIQ
nr:unnamed protein product [Fasciola hepatica]